MANLTLVMDEALIKAARMRAISEGTSVSALVRGFLIAYAGAGLGASASVATAAEPPPKAAARTARPRRAKGLAAPVPAAAADLPDWLQAVRERVEAFGGAEPEDWLPARDKTPPRKPW